MARNYLERKFFKQYSFDFKVTAFDADSKENGEIQYHKINGDSKFIDSVEIDMNNGNVYLVSNKDFDRETTESKYLLGEENLF